jgi:Domain of unknown function DUF29
MEELLELRQSIEEGRYTHALFIVDELTEMAKEDKINKIGSFMVILLLHLIKSHAEGKMTSSWERSMRVAIDQIQQTNERRSSGTMYLSVEELSERLENRFPLALREAAAEAFGGVYSHKQLAAMIDPEVVRKQALDYIMNGIPDNE